MLKNSESPAPWYGAGLSFSCTQCGNCCTGGPGYVWISKVELERLAVHLGLDVATTLKRYCHKPVGGGGRISLKEIRTEGGLHDCIFLTKDERGKRGCSIYPVRPLQCRTWPFWDGLLASREAWDKAGQKCPGMDNGRAYTLEEIEARRTATDWPKD
jgi:uncharacterized protein